MDVNRVRERLNRVFYLSSAHIVFTLLDELVDVLFGGGGGIEQGF